MNMSKKIKGILGLSFIVSMLLTTSVSASPIYQFNLKNTGQSYNYDSNSGNTKIYAGQSWTFKPYHLETGGSPYGMVFTPYRLAGKHYCTSSKLWRKNKQYDLVHVAFSSGKTGSYYLGARIDDSYNRSCASDGWWNSDWATK